MRYIGNTTRLPPFVLGTIRRLGPGSMSTARSFASSDGRRSIPCPCARMRYFGNRTRILSFVLGTIRRLGIEPGIAHDAFAGTAAVGRALKGAGLSVVSSDIM